MYGIQGTLWRFDVRLTDVQVIDMNSVTLGCIGILRQFANW